MNRVLDERNARVHALAVDRGLDALDPTPQHRALAALDREHRVIPDVADRRHAGDGSD